LHLENEVVKKELMMIQFKCSCGKAYNVKDEFSGRKTKCGGCGTEIVVPRPRAKAAPNPEPELALELDEPAVPKEGTEEWHYTLDKEEYGPVSLERLKLLARDKTLDREDTVWKEGMADWIKAESLEGLFSGLPPARNKNISLFGKASPLEGKQRKFQWSIIFLAILIASCYWLPQYRYESLKPDATVTSSFSRITYNPFFIRSPAVLLGKDTWFGQLALVYAGLLAFFGLIELNFPIQIIRKLSGYFYMVLFFQIIIFFSHGQSWISSTLLKQNIQVGNSQIAYAMPLIILGACGLILSQKIIEHDTVSGRN
jgi:hypothetical protein